MRIIEIIADESYLKAIQSVSDREEVADHWEDPPGEDGRRVIRMVVEPGKRQDTLDTLQAILGNSENVRIHMFPVEVTLPRKNNGDEDEKGKDDPVQTTREEIYNTVEKSARLDQNYLIMIFLSTVVVAIGLLKNNVAVVIGAAKYDLALGAALLFAINVVCLHLSANVTFLLCGVTPRTWIEKQKARQSVTA